MKKSIKVLITSCVAAIGVGASFGGAMALYQKDANKTEFSIGTYTHTAKGTVTYKFGDVYNSLNGAKVDPTHKDFTLKVPLGGVYSNDIPAQQTVYGNLSVKATIGANLVDHVEWSVWIDGYKQNYDEQSKTYSDTYWSNWDGVRKFTDGNATLTATETTIGRDMVVNAVENPVLAENPDDQVGQVLCVYFNFKDITDANFLDYAESNVDFSFYFNEPSNTRIPAIRGDKTGWSADALEYRMVPNIYAPVFEWMFEGLTGFNKLYIHDEDTNGSDQIYYVKAKYGQETDEFNNVLTDPEKTYSLYYQEQSGEYGDRFVLVTNTESNTIYVEA